MSKIQRCVAAQPPHRLVLCTSSSSSSGPAATTRGSERTGAVGHVRVWSARESARARPVEGMGPEA